jgi:hypothetical protein
MRHLEKIPDIRANVPGCLDAPARRGFRENKAWVGMMQMVMW